MQESINERLKILIQALNMSARAFSAQLEVPESNTRNYLDKDTKLNSDYLARIANHFKSVNLRWLITGEGEPFLGDAPTPPASITNKKNKGSVQNNTGDHNTINNNVQLDNCKRDLDKATVEVKHLQAQLTAKEDVIASKDALIESQNTILSLLRGGSNRPN